MNIIASIVATTFTFFLMASSHAETAAHRAERVLANDFRRHYLPVLVDQLQSLDEPRWQIEAIAGALVDGYADCVISAMKVSRDPGIGEYVHLVASGYSPKQIEKYFSYLPENDRQQVIGSLEEPVRACVNRVNHELRVLRLDNENVLTW